MYFVPLLIILPIKSLKPHLHLSMSLPAKLDRLFHLNMDAADSETLCGTVVAQGRHIGSQEQRLHQMVEQIAQLSATLSQVGISCSITFHAWINNRNAGEI